MRCQVLLLSHWRIPGYVAYLPSIPFLASIDTVGGSVISAVNPICIDRPAWGLKALAQSSGNYGNNLIWLNDPC